MALPQKGVKVIVQNRRARHDYFVLDTWEAGIELRGTEVKSLRMGKCNLKDSFAQVKNGEIQPEDITEETIGAHLYTAHMPDPDLIIRPSGEIRTSNFLLWQSAYSEYYFTDVLWPDFKTSDLDAAIDNFNSRNRRFGGV